MQDNINIFFSARNYVVVRIFFEYLAYSNNGGCTMELSKSLSMPASTDSIEQGKRNLDKFGITVHKNFISNEKVRMLKERLEEQAELEREHGSESSHRRWSVI